MAADATTDLVQDARRCRRGPRCGRRDRDGQPALVELPGLCERDMQLLVAALRDLPDLHAELGGVDALEPARHGVGSPSGRHAGSPAPLQLDPIALADEILDELTRWEDVVRDRCGMQPAPGRRRSRMLPNRRTEPDAAVVARAAQLLGNTTSTLLHIAPVEMVRWSRGTTRAGERLALDVEDGAAGAGALIDLYRLAQVCLGTQPEQQHLRGRDCPGCAAETLRLVSADGEVICTTCRDVWAEHEYDLLGRVLAGYEPAPREHGRQRVWSSDEPPAAVAS